MQSAPIRVLSISLPLAAAAALAVGSLGLPSRASRVAPAAYDVLVFPVLAGQDSGFPKAMSRDAVIVGHFGSDPWDPFALPAIASTKRVGLLPKITDSLNFALGIGGQGLVVGSTSNNPAAWQSGVPVALASMLPGFGPGGTAHGVNESGSICGVLFHDFTGQQIPVHWPSGSFSVAALPTGPATGGAAFAINDQGAIAGALQGGGVANFQAARWDGPNQTPVLLGVLPGAMNSEMVAINAEGDTAGRSSFPDFSTEAVLHVKRTNTLVGLGHLGGNYSFANAVNRTRRVVGTSSEPGGTVHAFLWENGTMHDLNNLIQSTSEPILYLSSAVGIDDKGRIAAEAVVATPTGVATRIALLTPAP